MPDPSNKVPNWTNKKKNTRTLWQKLRGNDPPLEKGSLKKTVAPEYLLRAANMLSERSNNTRNTNLKLLKNKKNTRNLRKLLGKTRKNRNNRK